jgi:tRNA(Ile)-lysidine synthase
MLQKFKQHIDTEFDFLNTHKLLIAVSGGIDSVVLAHLATWIGFDFAICHCNFQLRGEESDGDEAFVNSLAKDLGVPFFTTKFDTEAYANQHKLSIQVAARDLRYDWFYKLLKEHSYEYVLTAHNTNDNLETFLINLTRGTGLEGLTGIPPINEKSVRPLLNFSRDDITMFAIKNGIVWREDRSNATIKYVRNKVRHKILPVLKEINPHLLETFKDTLEHLNESQDIIDDQVAEISKKIRSEEDDLIKFNISKLNKLKNPKAYLYQILQPYGFTEWNDVLHLLSAQPGKQVFSKTHRLLKDRTSLLLTTINKDLFINEPIQIEESAVQITHPIRLEFQKTSLNETSDGQAILVDKDLLKYPLSVRKWGYGDYICPVGMQGSKKLSQLFKDKKLSLIDKERIWLLTNADDEIIWVIGLRQDRRFAASEQTENRLKIFYKS